jgi:MoxR-like ATPase
MQEQVVTVGTVGHPLPKPFFVLATQNPIEMEGTYPLPRSGAGPLLLQAARRLPVARRALGHRRSHCGPPRASRPAASPTATGRRAPGSRARDPLASHVSDYAVRLVLASHPELPEAAETAKRNVRFGASPRAAQAMIMASKIHAVLAGRVNVSFDDVKRVALPALRHRLILNFDAEAKGMTADRVVAELLAAVPEQG